MSEKSFGREPHTADPSMTSAPGDRAHEETSFALKCPYCSTDCLASRGRRCHRLLQARIPLRALKTSVASKDVEWHATSPTIAPTDNARRSEQSRSFKGGVQRPLIRLIPGSRITFSSTIRWSSLESSRTTTDKRATTRYPQTPTSRSAI